MEGGGGGGGGGGAGGATPLGAQILVRRAWKCAGFSSSARSSPVSQSARLGVGVLQDNSFPGLEGKKKYTYKKHQTGFGIRSIISPAVKVEMFYL